MLFEQGDVNPNQAIATNGQTSLLWAAANEHWRVVIMLLERDVNPDQADNKFDLTLLSFAAENGHSGIVKTLLELGDVNPDQRVATCSGTPLLRAAQNGQEELVKMLLERERTPIPTKQTPNMAKRHSRGRLRTEIRES